MHHTLFIRSVLIDTVSTVSWPQNLEGPKSQCIRVSPEKPILIASLKFSGPLTVLRWLVITSVSVESEGTHTGDANHIRQFWAAIQRRLNYCISADCVLERRCSALRSAEREERARAVGSPARSSGPASANLCSSRAVSFESLRRTRTSIATRLEWTRRPSVTRVSRRAVRVAVQYRTEE